MASLPASPQSLVDPRHLWRWLALVLVMALGLVAMNSRWALDSRINPTVPLSAPRVVHNATVQGGEVWVGPNLGPHAEVDWGTTIRSHRRYLIELSLDNPEKFVSPRVNIDLYGRGYDHPQQQFLAVVPTSVVGYRASAIVDSGSAPPSVSLRVVHLDPARVRVARVSMRLISRSYAAAVTLLGIVFAIALAGLCATCIQRLRLRGAAAAPGNAAIRQWWLLATLLSILLVVVFNGFLGPPQVYADEYAYWATAAGLRTGEWAGLRDTSYQQLPNRLFFAVYELSGFAKNAIAAARNLGAVWVVAGLVPLYLVAAACNVLVAGVFAALAYVLGPVGTYSAYFTPEAMFAATFTAACALAAIALESRAVLLGVAAATAFAALTYVKPNGWAVVAAMVVFVAAHGLRQSRIEALRIITGLLVALASFAAAWLALGLMLPDMPSRTKPLGIYAGIGERALRLLESVGNYPLVARYLVIHLVIVTCLAGPALVYGLQVLVKPASGAGFDRGERIARVVTGSTTVILFALVAMTAVFSASFAGHSASDNAFRLHTRYYDFALPLLALGFVASPAWREWTERTRVRIALVWAVAALACAFALPQFNWGVFDSPDLFAGDGAPAAALGLFGFAGAAFFLLFRRRAPRGLQLAMFGTFVAAALGAGVAARIVQYSWETGFVDRAGRFAAPLAEEAGAPIIAMMHPAGGSLWIYRFASYAPTRTRFLSADRLPFAVAEGLPAGAILVGAGEDMPRAGVAALARFGPLEVARLVRPITAASDAPEGLAPAPGEAFVVSFGFGRSHAVRYAGLHAPEGWGAWSSAPEIDIDLPFSIRGNLRLTVEGRALGANAGKPITLAIGPHAQTFTLSNAIGSVDLNLALTDPQRRIRIYGFEQFSGQELGLAHDDRQLGIGLSSIRFTSR